MLEPVSIFRVSGTLFAAPLEFLSEVTEVPAVARTLSAPPGVVGAVNVRGSLACLLDVASIFGLGDTTGSLGLVFRCGSRTVVVPVDDVLDVAEIDLSFPRPLPGTANESLVAACPGVVSTAFGWACVFDITKAVLA